MVTYIGTQEMQAHLRKVKPETAISRMAEMIKEDYLRWASFDKSARVANHSDVGVIELMPISDGKNYSFKYVNGHPKNTQAGLLTVTAFGVLADVETGYPRLLSELTLTTALRTAATSTLAAKYMARPDSRSMALIGNGAQSEFQAIAFHAMLGINEIRVFDVDPAATQKIIHNLRAYPNLRVIRAGSVAEAVKGADIITTVTADKTNATILTPEMIEPGMHINGVGGDCQEKQSYTLIFCIMRLLWLNMSRNPELKVNCSRCQPTSKSQNCGKFSKVIPQEEPPLSKSPSLILLVLRWKIFLRCVT